MQATVTIIGAGFAGAACAYFLGRAGVRGVVVLERETQAGVHASGKNAAMARQFTPDVGVMPWAAEGTQFLYDPPHEVADRPLITPVGSIILSHVQHDALEPRLATAHGCGIAATVIRPAEWMSRATFIPATIASRAVWTPTDGVVDIHAYLTGLLRGAQHYGAKVVTNAPVQSIQQRGDRFIVMTPQEEIESRVIVNAAGAWVNDIAALVDIDAPRFMPLRRHLLLSEPVPRIDPTTPFVWDDAHGWYCRPESGGLLFSPCDETPVAPDDVLVDPAIQEQLATLLAQHCPSLAGLRIVKSWSGLRTFAPDRRFLIQWDPQCHGFFWIAGMGGHGVTCAAAIGRRAAAMIRERV